jgi:microcystin degradation protein MlrC
VSAKTDVPRRVGITGFEHEANALAAVVGADGIVDVSTLIDDLATSWIAGPLVTRLRELADVEIVVLPVWIAGACGPLDDMVFEDALAATLRALEAACAETALDAVIVLGHGAGRTVQDLDTDATLFSALRREVGGEVPVVALLDFHANLSPAMCDAVDVVVGYRTNPHVDIAERLVEVAEHTVRLLDGDRTTIVSCSTPLVLPQIAQLTTAGEPLAEVMALAEAMNRPPIRNISVFGGFSLTDAPTCGVSVCATVDVGEEPRAIAVVEDIARRAVVLRDRYRITATPLDETVQIAAAASHGRRAPVILADVADNPGGGAPATSTFVLEALVEAGVSDVVLGVQCDADAVGDAWSVGVGARFRLVLNRSSGHPLATRFEADAEVLSLAEGQVVPDRGVYAGAHLEPGRMCAVAVGGVRLAIASRPVQCADVSMLTHVGLDPGSARVVVVKSRGHFRAGFDHLFGDDQIVEVGAPGVTPVDLTLHDWQHLPRPCFPFDAIDDWRPTATVHGTVPA